MAHQGGKRAVNRRPSMRHTPRRSRLDTELPYPVSSAPRPYHNLPTQLTSFVGREREIAGIEQALPQTRLLTLTGAGGCGKTRLALQVAAGLVGIYADGVWRVELASLSDATLVPKAVASALGIAEQPDLLLIETLRRYFQTKSLLLILDNCEHLLSACADLAHTLLQTCPNLKILATSREPLAIPGEATWRVPSLSLPDLRRPPDPERLMKSEALRLFVERAAGSHSGFQITRSNATALAQVTHRLDGIPLAIELAAARVKALSVDAIAARLDDQFRLLTGGSRISLPRHQTLRATLDWSYDLLSEQEQILLRRLSVFAGGWTLEAAEKVCMANGLQEGDILDLLTHLVGKSLVLFDERDGQARYRLLEMVRQYGRDRLLESEKIERLRDRHLNFFLLLAEKAEPQLEGAEQAIWFNRLEAEHDNLREALAWSLHSAPEKGLQLAGVLGRFWMVRGYFTEGRRWLKEALEKRPDESGPLRAKSLNWIGRLASWQRDYAPARALHEESLEIYRELSDKRGIADSTYHLGIISMMEADHGSAVAFFQESLMNYRQLGHEQGVLEVLGDLGHEAWHQGDHAAARQFLEEALTIARESGQTRVLVFVLYSLGLVAFDQHSYEEGHSLYAEGLAAAKELGYAVFSISLVEAFAALVAAEGQYARAARLLGAAEAHRKSEGVPLAFAHRSDYDRPVAVIRAGLTEEAFATAWAEGGAMTLEQAIEDALTPTGAGPAKPTRPEKAKTEKEASLLTPRERQVAALIARGLTNRDIASQLEITERTAETHVRNILNKVKVNSRTQLAVWAVAHGLESLLPG